MLVLHVFLWIQRMKEENDYPAAYEPATEALLEILFDDLDAALRELGVGDTGVPRRIKSMAEALYGRIEAYEQALESKDAVHAALRRNVFGPDASELAVNRLQLYLGYVADYFNSCPASQLAMGVMDIPDPQDMMG